MKRPIKKSASKKPVRKKKDDEPKPGPAVHKYPCTIKDCERVPAYCRVEKSGNAEDGRTHYCAPHWQKVVESKKAWALQVVAHAKSMEAKRIAEKKTPKKRIKRKVKA